MKLVVKAICQKGGSEYDGLDCQDTFTDYIGEDFPKCVNGGYMSFKYDPETDTLYTVTEYETDRKLTPEEEEIVIEYTQGQWADGIGEGFEQQDDNPSPWHTGQIAEITYT